MRKVPFVEGYYYHIYNRGTERRKIFLKNPDYHRFIQQIKRFNQDKEGWPLVDIVAYCLMPNHFHFILSPKLKEGISLFMQKLGTGYTMYFNKKYGRTGVLFEGTFKSIMIEDESYLLHLTRYIHLNPVELIEPDWKEKGIENWDRVNRFLEKYRWSSYMCYIGKEEPPFPLKIDFIKEFFDKPEGYKKFLNEWMVSDLEKLKSLDIQ